MTAQLLDGITYNPIRPRAVGVFDDVQHYATYAIRLRFNEWYIGGTPKDPDVMEAWLRTKTGVEDEEELAAMVARTLVDMGQSPTEPVNFAMMESVSESIAAEKHTNGFKRDINGIYIEDRTIKAAVKESINIVYAGTPMGKTRKGAKNFLAERVFCNPERLRFITEDDQPITEPTGRHRFIGHVTGPQGPRSSLTYHEYVEQADMELEFMVTQDAIPSQMWPYIWRQMEEIGLGSLRSQSFGRFKIIKWQKTGEAERAWSPPVAEKKVPAKKKKGESVTEEVEDTEELEVS